jgi:hypothetical protein
VVPFNPTPSEKLGTILQSKVPRLDSLYRRGDIRFFKQCPTQTTQITKFLFQALHARTPDELYTLAVASGTPFRERITWFLLFQQSLVPLQASELSLWSALTASETQPYLEEEVTKELLWKLWSARMTNFLA